MSPQPKTGVPLSSEDVGLLVAGDVLRHAEGVFRFVRVRDCGDVVVDAPVLTPYDRPEAFTFIGRPSSDGWIPAPEGGWGENPVPGMRVEARLRFGEQASVLSDLADWRHRPRLRSGAGDIIAIRLPDHISEVREKVEPANGEVAAAVGWTAWPRKSSDARYEIGARDEWEAPVCGFCEHHIDVTCDATIIGGEVLHLVHTGCIPDELRAQPNGGAK